MDWILQDEVGPGCRNLPDDVRLVRALLNVDRRQQGDMALAIHGAADHELFAALARLQNRHGVPVASSRVAPHSRTWQWLLDALAASRQPQGLTPPTRARLSWDFEGQEGGNSHSRGLWMPSRHQGLRLGRGFSLAERSQVEVQQWLHRAGVGAAPARMLSGAARLRGAAAQSFVLDHDLLDFQITPATQLALFELSVQEAEREICRICALGSIATVFGVVNWQTVDHRIQDVVIDLQLRGDYTDAHRPKVQPALVSNDRRALWQAMQGTWPGVPVARQQRRVQALH
ncbi:MAG: hypothetical protein LAT63_17380 [Marinobacter sp.]|nr:hypothetical protein [Marinobacter sp.]